MRWMVRGRSENFLETKEQNKISSMSKIMLRVNVNDS
jgi:hypothetical protein